MNEPLVSIITITYNRADLIHRCIESIQKQSFVDYEHIIVDGNSSDNTEQVVKGYNDVRIRYIKLKKNGCAYQLRAGADIARGKYITFLDDDDEYLPQKIEKQVALFESLPADYGVVYCWMTYYDNDNPETPIRVHKTELRGDVKDIVVSRPLVSGNPTMMIRRDVFEQYGVTYNDNIGYIMSDWEMMARICQHCKVDFVPESLVKVYVNHGHSRLSTDFYGEKAKKGIVFHTYFLTTFSEIFSRCPQYAKYHYSELVKCNWRLKKRKESIRWLKKFLALHPSLKEVLQLLRNLVNI